MPPSPARRPPPIAVWMAFAVLVVMFAWNPPAMDLTASYVAGSLVAEGKAGLIYHSTADDPVPRRDPAWAAAAAQAGIADDRITPYVQTPLWAWLMAPLTRLMRYAVFKRVFAALLALSTIVTVDRTARTWAPALRGTPGQASVLAALCFAVPFEQSVIMGQTHMLFLCLSVLAAGACLSGRPILAGALLAMAAAVKITPGWLALAWLVSGHRRAAASFVAWLIVLTVLAIQATDLAVFHSYLSHLRQYGQQLLLSFNNDSLATVLLGGRLTEATAFRWEATALPAWVSVLSAAAAGLAALAGGLLDRRLARRGERQIGAVLVLVAATAATPLAWNHYYVVLMLPAMLFADAARRRCRWAWAAMAAALLLLDMWPLAYTVGAPLRIVALRSEFWAACLSMAGVAVLGLSAGRAAPARAVPVLSI